MSVLKDVINGIKQLTETSTTTQQRKTPFQEIFGNKKTRYVLEKALEHPTIPVTDVSITKNHPKYSPEDLNEPIHRLESLNLIDFKEYEGDDIEKHAFQLAKTRTAKLIYTATLELTMRRAEIDPETDIHPGDNDKRRQ